MFFGKKKRNETEINDIIWMSQDAKDKGILDLWRKDPSVKIICWFESTYNRLRALLLRETTMDDSLIMTQQVHSSQLSGSSFFFAEHYPLFRKEKELYDRLLLPAVTIHSSLEEPVFQHFGGEKIIKLMKQMGMKENESVQHKLISKAIVNAQEKIEKKVVTELSGRSQEEWLRNNLRSY